MRYTLFFVFLSFLPFFYAQNEDFKTELVDGKKCYIHWVQNGNTLYALQNKYGVDIPTIIAYNPGVEKGLKEGQRIVIPVPTASVQHEVKPKETLYSISKQYNVAIDLITKANPGVENGLKIGQKLIIPGVEQHVLVNKVENDVVTKDSMNVKKPNQQFKINFSDSIINYKVQDGETLYSISKRYMISMDDLKKANPNLSSKIKPGDILQIPIKKEKIEVVKVREIVPNNEIKPITNSNETAVKFEKKNNYTIAVFLPFNLEKPDGDLKSQLAVEFYMGAKLALDSLQSLGLNAKFLFLDVKADAESVKTVLLKPELKKVDAIVGPFLPAGGDLVAQFCKENKIRMICPLATNPNLIKNNPYVFQTVPSDATQMKGMAEYILKNQEGKSLLLIKPTNEKDLILYESFRSSILAKSKTKIIETNATDFTTFLKKGLKYIIVAPLNDKVLITRILNNLVKIDTRINSDDIQLVGTKEWIGMEEIKSNYRDKYHFIFSSPNDLNFKYKKTQELLRLYRKNYQSDLTKSAVQGYDVMLYFGAHFLLEMEQVNCIMNDFNLKQLAPQHGFENEKVFIIQQENYQLVNVE